jgi:hypothetical protein
MKKYIVPDSLTKLPEIENIRKALDAIADQDILNRLTGNCVAGSDMVQNLLHHYGVESKTTECQIFVTRDNAKVQFLFIGFNNLSTPTPNVVDTHVVAITETNPPVLIDVSLGNLLPEDNKIVLFPLLDKTDDKIGEAKLGSTTITYYPKKNLKLPSIHQKNLVQRIRAEEETSKKLTFLQKAVIGLGLFSITNFLLNVAIITIKLVMG